MAHPISIVMTSTGDMITVMTVAGITIWIVNTRTVDSAMTIFPVGMMIIIIEIILIVIGIEITHLVVIMITIGIGTMGVVAQINDGTMMIEVGSRFDVMLLKMITASMATNGAEVEAERNRIDEKKQRDDIEVAAVRHLRALHKL